MPIQQPSKPAAALQARAALYRMLSEAFQDRAPRPIDAKAWKEVSAESGETAVALPRQPKDLAKEFRAVFGRNLSPDCPPYGTQYGKAGIFRKTQELADISGFYRAFGVEPAPGEARPDYLPVQLEFVSLLCRKEGLALERGDAQHAEISREARRRFLGRHVIPWLPAFVEALRKKALKGYVAELAAALERFVRADVERLGWVPEEDQRGTELREEPNDACGSCFGGIDETV